MARSMFPALDAIVERKLAEAAARGEFDNLPHAGRPLAFDDDPLVPEEMRLACRVMKNAGCVPAELLQLAEINELIAQLDAGRLAGRNDGTAASAAGVDRRLRALLLQLELAGRPAAAQAAWLQYRQAVERRLAAQAGDAVPPPAATL